MKELFLFLIIMTSLQSCTSSSTEPPQSTLTLTDSSVNETDNVALSPQSQYVIAANTMIFYDRSISDDIKARKFLKCLDVFTAEVYAKLIRQSGSPKDFRVLSIIYDERQLLDIASGKI